MACNMIEKNETQAVQRSQNAGGRTYRPSVDIRDLGDELQLLADVPGARAEDIEVQYENGVLSLHAAVKPRREAGTGTALLCEYGVGDFARTFQVGEGIDAANISAEIADGVLTLRLPKTVTAKSRRIDVRTA